MDWDVVEDAEGNFTVTATNVLGEDCEVFAGTQEECELHRDWIEGQLAEELPAMIQGLCKALVQRDDKIAKWLERSIAGLKR